MSNPELEKQKLPLFHLSEKYPDAKSIFSTPVPSLEEFKDEALVVLDTNVLLIPYEIQPKSLNEIINTYKFLLGENRLFIPSQVAREFATNRGEKIKNLYQVISLKQNLNVKIEAYKLLESVPEYKDLLKDEEELNEKLNGYRKTVSKVLKTIRSWRWNDPVSNSYRELFTPEIIIDLKISKEDIEKDLTRRLKNRIPPGFKDAGKDDNGIGDVIIWNTILQLGQEHKKPVIFVSGETKPDWMLKSNKEVLYPDFELIEEFVRASDGKAFHILKFSEFLDLFGAKEEVVKDVKKEEIELKDVTKSVVSKFFDNDKRLLNILVNSIFEVLGKYNTTLRKIFESEDIMAEIEKSLAEAGYNTDLLVDEESQLVEIAIAINEKYLIFDKNTALQPEFIKLVELQP